MSELLIDVGSTYFKIGSDEGTFQKFRNFEKSIFDDLMSKFGETISRYKKDEIFICSSANGGLSTLIIGLTESFSTKYATNIAYNSGINIIDTILYHNIDSAKTTGELLDVVIIAGGIDSIDLVFDERLFSYLEKLNYSNIVYVGSKKDADFLKKNIDNLIVLKNIIDEDLKMDEDELKEYLTNLYQKDIVGKEDIKELYKITSNQIFSTPYIVNQSLPFVDANFEVINPFIVVDIGGATTDIHYSKDLVRDNMLSSSEYDRLVFKKLGVYKSRESLIFTAKNNEFVYELLNYLNVTENILEEYSNEATKILMQLSIFLVLCKVSIHNPLYVTLKMELLKSIVFTGGITKVLEYEEIEKIVEFFYKKVLNTKNTTTIVLDKNYYIWTLGLKAIRSKSC